MFYKFFLAATEKMVAWSFDFQLSQYKCGIFVADTEVAYDPGGFLSAELRPLSQRFHDGIKFLMVQSSRSWSRSSCQIDIVNWRRHVIYLQYVSSVMEISRTMSLRHRYNIRMSTGSSFQKIPNFKLKHFNLHTFGIKKSKIAKHTQSQEQW